MTNSKSRIERNPPSPRLRRGSSRFAGEEEEEDLSGEGKYEN